VVKDAPDIGTVRDEGDCTNVKRGFIWFGRTGTVGLQSLRDGPQEDAQCSIACA